MKNSYNQFCSVKTFARVTVTIIFSMLLITSCGTDITQECHYVESKVPAVNHQWICFGTEAVPGYRNFKGRGGSEAIGMYSVARGDTASEAIERAKDAARQELSSEFQQQVERAVTEISNTGTMELRGKLTSESLRKEVVKLYTDTVIKGAKTIRTYLYPGHRLYPNSRIAYALVVVPKDKINQANTDTFTAENLSTLDPQGRGNLGIYREISRMIREELAN